MRTSDNIINIELLLKDDWWWLKVNKKSLPNQLAELYGAARNTVRKSLGDLNDLGLIQKIKGKGSLVLDSSRYAFPVAGITSFKELNETLGMKAKTEVLRLEEIEQLPANIKVEQVDQKSWTVTTS